MDKLKMHSPDLVADNIDKIAALFPNCITEGRDEDGSVRRMVDFDLLRQELSGQLVEGPQERYTLSWPGKNEAILAANAPIAKTLRPCEEESVDFNTTKNIFIEGDNLDALKLLQETYLNQVKMIYIDPPYNRKKGNDLIYNDDYVEDTKTFLKRSNQSDDQGNRLVENTDANGRFHSEWLSMIYPRLKIAKNLLSSDGCIFLSIDDNEIANLKRLCDEIFGSHNFLVNFSWRTGGNFDNQAKFKKCHEYIIGYAKSADSFPHPKVIDPNVNPDSKLFKSEIRNTIVKNGPKNPISDITLPVGFPCDFSEGKINARTDLWPNYKSEVEVKFSRTINPVTVSSGWSSKELLERYVRNGYKPIIDAKGQETEFVITINGAIEAIKKRSDNQSHVISTLNNFGGPQKAASEIEKLGIIFDDYPKPTKLLKYLLRMINSDDFIVLDFFSGSSSTADAVMQLNKEDGGSRRFFMVQLPESCNKNKKAFKAGYETIPEIGKERIRRVGKKIISENAINAKDLDVGFRVFKIDSSNMKDVYYAPDDTKQVDLELFADHIKADRRPEDLLFQVFLDWGLDLSLPIEKETIQGKAVFFVDGNVLAACFDSGITEDFVKILAKRQPLRAVFRDDGFGDDSAKINVEQIFKVISPETEVKSI